MIEPTIKLYLSQPLDDFREMESLITQAVMESEGIYKSEEYRVLSINKGDEEIAEEYVDVEKYKRIQNMHLKTKIDHLYRIGLLREASYNILDWARDVRNKIHEPSIVYTMSSKDYELFSMAYWISNQVHMLAKSDWEESIAENIISNTEKVAEKYLESRCKRL